MSTAIDFYYDLVSPNTYMANQVLHDVIQRTGATITYIPVLLGAVMKATNNQPPFITFASVKGKMEYAAVELERFVKKHGLANYNFNPNFPLNSLLIMRGAIVAEQDCRLEEYIAVGEKCVWEDGIKMDDPEQFVEALNQNGFDGTQILGRTQDSIVKEKLIANTEAAVDRGIFGVPTFFVGDEMFFGKDRLLNLEEELVR